MAVGASAGVTLLAGCSATTNSDDSAADSANFRLLITDLPADIGDFERLDVSFDSARIFEGNEEHSDDDSAGDGEPDDGEDGDESDDENGNEENGDGENGDTVEQERGFSVLNLDDATVDLTQVVGERAKSVFEGGLSEGTYNKIELHVSDVEGIVDSEEVEVKVPSEKLQITKPFEIRDGETVDFVFDINVVRRGQQRRYNLKPVISGSGVNGDDVDVEEVGGEPAN